MESETKHSCCPRGKIGIPFVPFIEFLTEEEKAQLMNLFEKISEREYKAFQEKLNKQ